MPDLAKVIQSRMHLDNNLQNIWRFTSLLEVSYRHFLNLDRWIVQLGQQ